MSNAPVLICRGLRKTFGTHVAVADLSLEVVPGQIFGLLGSNGAGKTTTLKMITGLVAPDQGEVLVAGARVDREPLLAKAAIGYVPHELALFRELTAIGNLRFWGRLQGIERSRSDAAAHRALDFVGLGEHADQRVSDMSSGTQRRLNLAVAVQHEPKLLVLDEPTVGVDAANRAQILDRLAQLCTAGTAVLYTSHYIDEAERICDVVGLLHRGKIVAQGTCRELISEAAGAEYVSLTVRGDATRLVAELHRMEGPQQIETNADEIRITSPDCSVILATVAEAARRCSVVIVSTRIVSPDLEQAFLAVTKDA